MNRKQEKTMTTYADIRGRLQTGDLVLFAGKGWLSRLIQIGTASRWSHVGMVLVLLEYNVVLLWESTTLSSLPDIVSGRGRKGVQLVALSERLRTYDGCAAVCHLKGAALSDADTRALTRFRHEVRGRPYEQSKLQLIVAVFRRWCGFGEDLSSLFCSELVAEAYQRMGLLDPDVPSNSYTPADFAEAFDGAVKLLKGRLGMPNTVTWTE